MSDFHKFRQHIEPAKEAHRARYRNYLSKRAVVSPITLASAAGQGDFLVEARICKFTSAAA
jgi:hypothetical protein